MTKWMVVWLLLSDYSTGHGSLCTDQETAYAWSIFANIHFQEYAHWIEPCGDSA